MQQHQPKGLSCVSGYGIVAFMPMGREKPRDYNSNDMHKMSRSFVIPKHVELLSPKAVFKTALGDKKVQHLLFRC